MASYESQESESRTGGLPGSHRKCEKPKMDLAHTFLSTEKREIHNFFQFCIL